MRQKDIDMVNELIDRAINANKNFVEFECPICQHTTIATRAYVLTSSRKVLGYSGYINSDFHQRTDRHCMVCGKYFSPTHKTAYEEIIKDEKK